MIHYAKMKYIATCSFYDAIERGDNRLVAAEKTVSIANSYEGVDRIIIIFTIVSKLIALNVELTSDLLNYTISAVKSFQSISKAKLNEFIPRGEFVQDLEVESRIIVFALGKRYNTDVLNGAMEGE